MEFPKSEALLSCIKGTEPAKSVVLKGSLFPVTRLGRERVLDRAPDVEIQKVFRL